MCNRNHALAGIVILAMAVAGAQGALLNLSWSDTDPNVQTLDLQPGETANLYVWALDLAANEYGVDSLSTVYFEYDDAPVEVIATDAAPVGWNPTHHPGIMGDVGVQFVSAANNALPGPDSDGLFGSDGSDWLIGWHTVRLQDGVFDVPGDYDAPIPITIDADLNVGLLDAFGGFYTYNSNMASAATGFGTYPGYYAFGIGSPFVPSGKAHPGQTENPLWIRVVPEPGGLLLLGLGGLAVVRRRRDR